MGIQINNILDLQLTNDDATLFINVFRTLKKGIDDQSKKIGFKKNGKITIELSEESIEFIVDFCDSTGIVSNNQIKEQEQEQ